MVTAILTTNITYADYIVGNVVGSIYNLPVYYVKQDPFSINQTIQELLQNNVTKVIIIGGPAVISNLTLQKLNESGISYVWIWGTRRYQTSAYVALYFWNSSDSAVLITRDLVNEDVKGSKLQLITEAVQTAEDNKIPLLIIPNGMLTPETVYALQKLNVTNVYIFTGEFGTLGNITDHLKSLNITYTIYTPNKTREMNCSKVVYVNITENTSWDEIREIFVGKVHKVCFVPRVVNETVNITKEKEEVENEVEDLFKEYRDNDIDVDKLISSRLHRIIETQLLLIYRFEILCNYTNNSLPICSILPQLNQSLYQTMQQIMSGNVTGLSNLLRIQNEIQIEDWKITRKVGGHLREKVEIEHLKHIEKEMKEHKEEMEDEYRAPENFNESKDRYKEMINKNINNTNVNKSIIVVVDENEYRAPESFNESINNQYRSPGP
jgi:hypothetical protein